MQFEEAIQNRDLPLVFASNLKCHENLTKQIIPPADVNSGIGKIPTQTIFELARVCHKFGYRKMAFQVSTSKSYHSSLLFSNSHAKYFF